jgi:hypothetical protein
MALPSKIAASTVPCSSAATELADWPTDTVLTASKGRPLDARRKLRIWWLAEPGAETPTDLPFKSLIDRILPRRDGATTNAAVGRV